MEAIMNLMNHNPFVELASTISPTAMQIFVIAMIALVIGGTLLDMVHKKNVKYFFENAKKTKEYATKNLPAGKAAAIVAKTVASDVMTSSEFCGVKRRLNFEELILEIGVCTLKSNRHSSRRNSCLIAAIVAPKNSKLLGGPSGKTRTRAMDISQREERELAMWI